MRIWGGVALLVNVGAVLALPGTAVANADEVPVAAAVCGSPLSAVELESVARLSDLTGVDGDALTQLESGAARLHEITAILSWHGDRRGLFGIGLDAVEQDAVMPLQRDPGVFRNRDYAHAISLELLRRYMRNLHAEFTGGTVEPHWMRYFELAGRCDLSPARAAMAGYNAHLTVDLSYSVAAVGSRIEDSADYFTIVATIAGAGDEIIDRTENVYHADLGPLWRFYFLGEGLDQLVGKGVATRPMLVLADLGANVVIFGNGLSLENPVLRDPTVAEIGDLYGAADTAFDVLSQLHAL